MRSNIYGANLPGLELTTQPSLDLVGAWKLPRKQTYHERYISDIREAKIKVKEDRINLFMQNKKAGFIRAQYSNYLKEINRRKTIKRKEYCERYNIYHEFLRDTQPKTRFPDPVKIPKDVRLPIINFPYNCTTVGKIPSRQISKTQYLGPRNKGRKVVSQKQSHCSEKRKPIRVRSSVTRF